MMGGWTDGLDPTTKLVLGEHLAVLIILNWTLPSIYRTFRQPPSTPLFLLACAFDIDGVGSVYWGNS